MSSAITLKRCIFCGAEGVSEEHIIAEWAFRAFARSRKPGPGFAGSFTAPDQLKVEADEPIQTAGVTCKPCNNGWLSLIDNDAARVLKPLIQGASEVTLDASGQTAFAAWIYKCALIFDAAQHGADGELASLRAGFMEARLAGPGCIMYASSAGAPEPFELPGLMEKLSFRLFGVRPVNGTVQLIVNGEEGQIPIPGYQILLGNLCVCLGGHVSSLPSPLPSFLPSRLRNESPAPDGSALRIDRTRCKRTQSAKHNSARQRCGSRSCQGHACRRVRHRVRAGEASRLRSAQGLRFACACDLLDHPRAPEKEAPMTRICLYTRISTDEENQPTSLASQRERLEAF